MAQQFPTPLDCMRTAILNDNPSLAADIILNAGTATGDNLNVVDTSGAGAGWGQPVNYNDILPGTVKYLPNAAGVFKIQRLNMAPPTFVAGQQIIVKVTQQGYFENGVQPYSQSYDYFVPTGATNASVTSDLATLLTNNSNGLVVATVSSSTNLNVEGRFGDLNLEVFDFTVSINVSTVTQSTPTALVNPVGTPQQVSKYVTSSLVTASGYNCYFATCRNFVQGDQSLVETDVLPQSVLVWVNSAGDSGAGTFNAEWTDIFTGAKSLADYVAR